MIKILFIMPGIPLAFNYSGGASRCAQNFLALKSLGVELHVVRFHINQREKKVLDFERSSKTAQAALQYARSWREVIVPANQPKDRWEILQRIFFDPMALEFPFYKSLAYQLHLVIEETAPDLIWAEHSDAAAAIFHLSSHPIWVYSSTDLRYLIYRIRNKKANLYQKIIAPIRRKVEIKISQSANFVVTGSITEADKLRHIGCKTVSVIPMAGPSFPEITLKDFPFPDVKLIHLGSLETTANRDGLSTYLSKAHLKTLQLCAENNTSIQLVIIGDSSQAKPPLNKLLLQKNIVLAGYISDLSSILRPFDIAILPYTHDSGYRTKIPLLMGSAQVIVATRAAVAGSLLPGMEDVCILLDRVEEFPQKIAWLSMHPDERRRRGEASRTFAKRYFSLDAVLPLYSKLLNQMI